MDVRNVSAVWHVEHLWRCCKRAEILKNKCETIETCCFGGGEREEGQETGGGNDKVESLTNSWIFEP